MELSATAQPSLKAPSNIRQVVRFVLHEFVVYSIVYFCSLSLAGFTYTRILPLIQQYRPAGSVFQFAFTHVFLFSFYPALIVAFIHAHWYEHRVAYFVWVVPLIILTYKFLTFPTNGSVLVATSHFGAAFHEYLAGDFVIGDFRTYGEMFDMVAWNPDMGRGLQQHTFTAPFYAGIGYAAGTLLGIKLHTPQLHAILRSMKPSLSAGKYPTGT